MVGLAFGPWLIARQPGGVDGLPRRQTLFSVSGCFAKQPGKVCRSFPFPLFFSRLFILTMYLGSLAATRSSQGGLPPAALGRNSFWSLVACAAARGGLRSAPHGELGFQSLAPRAVAREGSTVCLVRQAQSFSFFCVFHVHRWLFKRSKLENNSIYTKS